MLQDIRDRAQGMIAKFIIGFICLTFALFGVDALFGISSSGKTVAEVNDKEINERELNRALDLRKRRIIARMGQDVDPAVLDDPALKSSVLDEVIQRELLLQQARELGMVFSSQQVERMLLTIPDFQIEGRFNQDIFERAVRSQGMTPAMFRDLMQDEMVIAQLQFGLAESGFVTNATLDTAVRLEGQTRDIAWLEISALEQARDLKLEEAELQAYFEENQQQFMLPEKVRVSYVLVDRDKLAADLSIDESAVKAAYDQEVAALEAGEEREAAHLLLEVGEGETEEQVRQQAETIRAEIAAGLSFADAVSKYSEDVATKEMAGELGWVSKGTFGEKFDTALFSLEKGVVSEPVRTGFGYHLLKVSDIRADDPPALSDLREAIESRLRREQAVQAYAEKVEELSALAFESGDLSEPAAALKLEIRETGFFDRAGPEAEDLKADAWLKNGKFRSTAFSSEVREERLNSEVFEPEDGKALVVHLLERQEPEPRPFAEVRDQIAEELRRQRGAEMAKELGSKLLTEMKAGESAGSLAAQHALEWENRSGILRTAQGVPPRVLSRAFALQKPAEGDKSIDSVELTNGDYILLVVSGVHPGKGLDKYTEREIVQLRSFHANVRGSMQFQALQNALEDEADIRKF